MIQKNKKRILIKYGGNAMVLDKIKERVISSIATLQKSGFEVIVVHGGGPFIKEILKKNNIKSEFIGGHRKTSPEAYKYVEQALKGKINGELVNLFNKENVKAVGLSGKDGNMVIAKKMYHIREVNGKQEKIDIGQVGEVKKVNTALPELLLINGFIPVITCLASDKKGTEYNINADIFAGFLAGALKCDRYIVLTDVDGLLKDKDDPASLISRLTLNEVEKIKGTIIKGGMIPKIDSCKLAIENDVKSVCILNGTKPEQLKDMLINNKTHGTTIVKK